VTHFVDLTGQRFGRLLVERRSANRGTSAAWECACSCGARTTVTTGALRSGHTASCGCYSRERSAERLRSIARTHGENGSPEWLAWAGMRARCGNPKNHAFSRYGGRGIRVCTRWLDSYENFLADMGRKPSAKHSLDRIDNDGNYEPGNCRWATAMEQRHNRRDSRTITHNGETLSLADWARRTGMQLGTLWYRLSRGVPFEDAISRPLQPGRHWRLGP
jgi:hypothetical protein